MPAPWNQQRTEVGDATLTSVHDAEVGDATLVLDAEVGDATLMLVLDAEVGVATLTVPKRTTLRCTSSCAAALVGRCYWKRDDRAGGVGGGSWRQGAVAVGRVGTLVMECHR